MKRLLLKYTKILWKPELFIYLFIYYFFYLDNKNTSSMNRGEKNNNLLHAAHNVKTVTIIKIVSVVGIQNGVFAYLLLVTVMC